VRGGTQELRAWCARHRVDMLAVAVRDDAMDPLHG
jgi:hypothetical protein